MDGILFTVHCKLTSAVLVYCTLLIAEHEEKASWILEPLSALDERVELPAQLAMGAFSVHLRCVQLLFDLAAQRGLVALLV